MANLDLKRGVRSKVFRAIETVLRADPVLDRTIRTWVTWDGTNPSQSADLPGMCPILRLEPSVGPMGWFDPSSQFGPLVIRVGMVVQSYHAEDYLDLWEAIEGALYPEGNWEAQQRIRNALADLGAEIGQVEFSLPATTPDPRGVADGLFLCSGMMRISIVRQFL